MFDNARKVNIEGVPSMVWEGKLTKLIVTQLDFSTPAYTHITKALKTMGCASQLRRGGGGQNSQWLLHFAPSHNLWVSSGAGRIVQSTTGAESANEDKARDQRIRDLSNRVTMLEKEVFKT
jgi:hypothetical protein